ncbi:MAG: HlyD family efflux transporter periplasmic adaptor subunit [Bacteroidota bacterium]
MRQIFPQEIVEHTTNRFIPQNTVRGKIIYGTVLLACILGIGSLPFISVGIFSTAKGYIRPEKERVALTSVNSGEVFHSDIYNNKRVERGDTLLVLQNNSLDEQQQWLLQQSTTLKRELADLGNLLQGRRTVKKLITPKYQKELINYRSRLDEHRAKLEKSKIDYERNQKLYAKGVIAKATYEDIQLEYDLGKNALHQFTKNQLSVWQATFSQLEITLMQLSADSAQIEKKKGSYVITAPLGGTLMSITGIEEGGFITAGTTVGEISPEADLIAECQVSPLDIGLIDANKNVNFQVDAFNYNQWGMVEGEIISIGRDVEYLEGKPFYKVRCRLKDNELQLKNGFTGTLGKGMTLTARFELTERTLFQLLYDKVDDWINPGNAPTLVTNKH